MAISDIPNPTQLSASQAEFEERLKLQQKGQSPLAAANPIPLPSPATAGTNANLAANANPTAPEPPSEERKAELFSKWDEFLQRPEIAAAALQFGVNMLQPIAPGQSALGHLGTSVAAGAGALGRSLEQQRTIASEEAAAGLDERRVATGERQAGAAERGVDAQFAGVEQRREATKAQAEASAAQTKVDADRVIIEKRALGLKKTMQEQGIRQAALDMVMEQESKLADTMAALAMFQEDVSYTPPSQEAMFRAAKRNDTFLTEGAITTEAGSTTWQQVKASLQATPPAQWHEDILQLQEAGVPLSVINQAAESLRVDAERRVNQGGPLTTGAPAAGATATGTGTAAAAPEETSSEATEAAKRAVQDAKSKVAPQPKRGRSGTEVAARKAKAAETSQATLESVLSGLGSVGAIDRATYEILKSDPVGRTAVEAAFGGGAWSELQTRFAPKRRGRGG